ncbi:MAG: hypothetical protein ACYC7J_06265 [Syntrophales bacterium]
MNRDYCEIVIEGQLDLAKGFVMGFLVGRGIEGSAFFDDACHIGSEDAAGPLIRLISAHDNVSTLIVGAGLYDLLVAALNRHPQAIALGLKSVRPILSAALMCSFRTYSREVGGKIKEIFGCIPDGVDGNSAFEMHEKTDPEGKGVELFTPLHDYELTGKGRISGSVRGVLDLYERLKRFEVVELGELELTYGKTR